MEALKIKHNLLFARWSKAQEWYLEIFASMIKCPVFFSTALSPYEEESRPRGSSSKAAIPPPMYDEPERPRSPTGPSNSFLANMGWELGRLPAKDHEGAVAKRISNREYFTRGWDSQHVFASGRLCEVKSSETLSANSGLACCYPRQCLGQEIGPRSLGLLMQLVLLSSR